jgi:hypothetical protein
VRYWLPGLLLFFLATPGAQAKDALRAIDDCIAHLDGTDVGYERIATRCPDLSAALLNSPAAAWLPAEWNQHGNELSSRSLAELRALLVRELDTHGARAAPDIGHVADVLATMTESESAHRSLWARLKAWLHEALMPHQRAADESWVARWTAGLSLSRAARRLIGWSALAAVMGIAVSVILSELRVAGVLAPRAQRIRGSAPLLAQPGFVSLADIDAAEASARPGLLLELIAARLTAEQRLPAARALTVVELWRRARLDEDSRMQFAELSGVCERLRFSAMPVSPASLTAAVTNGRSVLATLDSVAAPAAGNA